MDSLIHVSTHLSDINELLLGYYLNDKKWFDAFARKHHDEKRNLVSFDDYDIKDGQANIMSIAVRRWAFENRYSKDINYVWWTARPGILSKVLGREIDWKKNPTDILTQFSKGPAEGFLGVSAKASLRNVEPGFKNLGLGTIEKNLNLDLKPLVIDVTNGVINIFELSKNATKRKHQIRGNPKVQKGTVEFGNQLLTKIRDKVIRKLESMTQRELREHIEHLWLDNSDEIFPPYVKVTGHGSKPPFSAIVDDPLNNSKKFALQNKRIMVEKSGDDSIGIVAGDTKILKMRAKFASEKMASSIKFSGDPWS